VVSMGSENIYKCNKCANEFKSREGGGFFFREYRCVNCDEIKYIPLTKGKNPVPSISIGSCDSCKGELRGDLKVMCPKCKTRDCVVITSLLHYD